ncbi:MAG TPA: UTRA domain-containing protein [Solirubrobacterales bacterium]|nr:UTRA domain-containing protein [Solirubrobacterales bacterium]
MFAADVLVDYPLGTRTRFWASLVARERTPGHTILSVEELPAAPARAAALVLPAGARVAERRALGLADGVPLTVGTSWFPLDRFPDAVDGLRRQAR